jgi:hypothetical protein
LGLVTLTPGIVKAQSFVQAGYVRELRTFSSAGDEDVFGGSANGLFGGGAIAFGNWTFGGELDLTRDTAASRVLEVTLPSGPRVIRSEYRARRRTLALLAGFQVRASPRVRIGIYGGAGWTRFRRTIASNAGDVVLDDPSAPVEFVDRRWNPIAGVDVAFAATPRVSLVAGLRAQRLELRDALEGYSVTPLAGLRVHSGKR